MANKQIIYVDDVIHETRESKIDFSGVSPGPHVLKVEHYKNDVLQDTVTRNITVEQADIIPSLIAYYKLDETSGGVVDSQGDYDGVTYGSVTRGVTGKQGFAYSLNGSNGYIAIPSLNAQFNGTSWSYGLWFKTTSATDYIYRIGENRGGGAAGTVRGWQLSMGLNSSYRNTLVDNGNGQSIDFEDVPYMENDGNWHLVIITWDSATGTFTLNIDGADKSSKTNTNLIGEDFTSALGSNVEIGRSSSDNQYFNGTLDEAFLCGKALTLSEKQAIYNNGAGITI